MYIISLVILKYLKIETIRGYSESHFILEAMITDVFCFPLYLLEIMGIQKFAISSSVVFYLNTIFGFVDTILLLIINEVIQFKILDIDRNTIKNIDERQGMEMQLINNDLTKLKDNNFYDEENNDFDDDEEEDDCEIINND